jgi:hypothetical protein
MTRQTMSASLERLGTQGRAQWDQMPAADFTHFDLRQEIHAALIAYYGVSLVHARNKCIQVDRRPGYVDADVVPCLEYHWYRSPGASLNSDYVEGIKIFPSQGGTIVNFPKEHINNGQTKNGQCLDRYKKTVRQMKRLRNRAISEGRLTDGVAPGYLLECMTYNVPPDQFVTNDSERLNNVVLWLKFASKQSFRACDGIHYLFVDDPGVFSVGAAQKIIDGLWETY